MDPITLGLGAAYAVPTNQDHYTGYAYYAARAFVETASDFRFSLGAEKGRNELMGQGMGDTQAFTVEGSYSYRLDSRFSVTAGLGYWHPHSVSVTPLDLDEMAFTYLVHNHHNGAKPIPLDQAPWGDYVGCRTVDALGLDPSNNEWCYGSSFELNGAPYVSAGFEYRPTSWSAFRVEYRFMRPQASLQLWRQGRVPDPVDMDPVQGWWREDGHKNMDSLQVTFEVRY